MRYFWVFLVAHGALGVPLLAAEPAVELAPAIAPKLLFASRLGGPGDQWLPQVRVKGRVIQAATKEGLGLQVIVADDDSVSAKAFGNRAVACRIDNNLPNGGKEGPYQWGYNQVHPLLQQPFLKGPGWQWWGWNNDQARSATATYAPFMADSRIRTVTILADRSLVAVGTADGGNTSLRADPRDINRNFPFPIGNDQTGGGGGGLSSWVFHISPQGEPLGQAVFRGLIAGITSDRWGRPYFVGQAVIKGDDRSGFGYGDGAGLVIADADWQKILFKTHFGCEDGGAFFLWGIDVDSSSGLAAVSGYCSGKTFTGVNAIQEEPGGDADGFVAVIRLWQPTP